MSFIVKNKQLLKKHTKIWEKIEGLMKINFESKLVYGDNDKYIKTKIKTYAGSLITLFHNKKEIVDVSRSFLKKKHHANVY